MVALQETKQHPGETTGVRELIKQGSPGSAAYMPENSSGFERFDQHLIQLNSRMDFLLLTMGKILTKLGNKLEDTVASALRYGLKRPDIHPEHILLRQKIVDDEQAVFPRRKEKEIDIVAMNDEHIIFEVKSSAKPDDVDDVAEIVELYQLQNPTVKTRGVLITLAPRQDVPKRCRQRGIQLLPDPQEVAEMEARLLEEYRVDEL